MVVGWEEEHGSNYRSLKESERVGVNEQVIATGDLCELASLMSRKHSLIMMFHRFLVNSGAPRLQTISS